MIRSFGTMDDGTVVEEIRLRADRLEAKILTFGATVRDLRLGGRPLVLGFDSLADYIAHGQHFGSIAGRCANRIAGGRFSLDGTDYQLSRNLPGGDHLHGGVTGFGTRVWTIKETRAESVLLGLVSPDGEEGYPGRVEVFCRYTLTQAGALVVELTGTTDRPTLLNLAHHSYFNLDESADILDHRLHIVADRYLPMSPAALPAGEVAEVAGTPFDFRNARPVRMLFDDGARVIYDHNFCLADAPRAEPHLAAVLEGPRSGIAMDLWTTEPGLQLYDAYKLDLPYQGLDGRRYGPNAGLCLEPQRWPDSPNHPDFAGAVLRPGETYRQVTEFRFHPGV
ncbi:aldose epimerase family protein [Polymorphum gilvum]|uniref:Aldose 1-epimerase n=1 Tax=Polymorphum gilvum (strain LMG 25793 / CGMCC 1.9160 / SL003B-26A1) TaxID=991905 RepID=F2J2S2_POLGS|nr:aldose epimerase family protein [Polymorphum gilvum]ADZ72096.1 Aldose 1-epimerase subfamily [Polymorphum gilvum SL003B-26A1]